MKKIIILSMAAALMFPAISSANNFVSTSQVTATANDMDKWLDEYESYVNNYITLMKKVQAGDPTAIIEYAKLYKQCISLQTKLNKNKSTMTVAQMNRFNKINQKLLKVGKP